MKIYDVTVPVSENIPIYAGDPPVRIEGLRSIADGSAANVSGLCFGAHTGTHVDAPAHFIEGAPKVETLPLDALIGEAEVIEVPKDRTAIDEEFVTAKCTPGTSRFLFKTRNS